MSQTQKVSTNSRWYNIAWLVIALFFLTRIYLSASLGLGDDEAYYWDWSRNLDWSYYDHPGATAYIIKLGTLIFGDSAFGVRIGAILCSAIAMYYLFHLSKQMYNTSTATLALLFYSIIPIFAVGSLLIVPDAPLAAGWMGFLFFSWQFYANKKFHLWWCAALFLAFGFWAKMPMIFCAFSFAALGLLMGKKYWLRKEYFLTLLIGGLANIPFLVWNALNDWPTLKYHLQERHSDGGGEYNINGLLQFLASQMIIVGPVLLILLIYLFIQAALHIKDLKYKFIFVFSAPTLLVFSYQSLLAEFKIHWPAPAYPLLFALAAYHILQHYQMHTRPFLRRLLMWGTITYAVLLSSLLLLSMHKPILPAIALNFMDETQWDPKFDPSNDVYGWDQVAQKIEELQQQQINEYNEPAFLAAHRYQMVAQLAFATKEVVTRIAPSKDHYQYTQAEDWLADLEGRNAILVTDHRYKFDPMSRNTFSDCQESSLDVYREKYLARTFYIYICQNYQPEL